MATLNTVKKTMLAFAAETGLSDRSREPRRYLWTDAFAVCNFLELHRRTADPQYLNLALQLVDQVHATLGKYHKDSAKSGWLSGLDDDAANLHPTLGGLRIGKKLDERQFDEPFDEALEWDRDGQYFHYLSKWMHALNAVGRETGNAIFHQWAKELAKTAHAAFTYTPGNVLEQKGTKRMVWKMSVDLTRPLVTSMGQHDALDGWLTCLELQATDIHFPEYPVAGNEAISLENEINELRRMCQQQRWVTQDSLGIGGLLSDAWKLTQLIGVYGLAESPRLESILQDCELSLNAFMQQNSLHVPARQRLAFRELGLSIGLQALNRIQQQISRDDQYTFKNKAPLQNILAKLMIFQDMHTVIEEFWLDAAHQSVSTWQEHQDINRVMLATSLAPNRFLDV